VEQSNQATNINVSNNYKHKQNYKTAREGKREHMEFVYLVRSNTDLVWGESSPPFHYNDEYLYKGLRQTYIKRPGHLHNKQASQKPNI